jgi:hypothetical protein
VFVSSFVVSSFVFVSLREKVPFGEGKTLFFLRNNKLPKGDEKQRDELHLLWGCRFII